MGPLQPYLFRAFYDWIVDNGWTPHIIVDVTDPAVDVPRSYAREGRIVLNIAPRAVRALSIENDTTSFETRFQGVSQRCRFPTRSVVAIYADEFPQVMSFPPEPSPLGDEGDAAPAPEASATAEPAEPTEPPKGPKGPRGLRIVK